MAMLTSFNIFTRPETPQDILHIYEHLLINQFYIELGNTSIPRYLAGWLNADTYDGVIMFDGGFYHRSLQRLWQNILKRRHHNFSPTALKSVLGVIELEDQCQIKIANKSALLAQINQNFTTPFIPIELSTTTSKAHRSVKLTVSLDSTDISLQKFFLRFYVVLSDLISATLSQKLPCYRTDNELIHRVGDHLCFNSAFSCDGAISDKEILNIVNSAIHSIDITTNYKHIKTLFRAFATEPLWQNHPIKFYEDTDIITTNKEVASLLSPSNIKSTLASISVQTSK